MEFWTTDSWEKCDSRLETIWITSAFVGASGLMLVTGNYRVGDLRLHVEI